jgi:aminoglycoside 3-N-acetyltransferase
MSNDIITKQDLIDVFGRLGLRRGMEVMFHSSLKSLGFVVNGPLDVIDALMEVVGEEGTLLMPSHTGQLTDPQGWKNPPISPEFVETVRQCMHPFDPRITPIRNRGVIPQTFLTYPGVKRSSHPLNSVIAKGANAEYFTSVHELHSSEGLTSPIGRLYERNGYVLLLGVTLARCTAIHLAEFIADIPYLKKNTLKVLVQGKGGQNEFVRLERYPGDSENFDKIRRDIKDQNIFKVLDFGNGKLIFFPIKPVVDFAVVRLREDGEYLLKP